MLHRNYINLTLSIFLTGLALSGCQSTNTTMNTKEVNPPPIQEMSVVKDSSQVTDQVFVTFTPPSGWQMADSEKLLPSVKMMVVGKGLHEFPPSINLSVETFPGTLSQYLKRVKEINQSVGAEWKDLGKILTKAGEASYSQVDRKTQWGEVRMMHVILNKDGMIYVMTAAALKDEFSRYYKAFFDSMSSLNLVNETN